MLSISTPRQRRIIATLLSHPEGVLSFDLRHAAGCANISDEICTLREKGFQITCEMEPYTTQDGARSNVGRYCLLPVQRHEVAAIVK